MARSKTQETNENAVNTQDNANRPPDAQIEAAVELLKLWAPKRLNPRELPERPKVLLVCNSCHVKAESNQEDPRCPNGCHVEGKSTMAPVKKTA